MDEKDRKDLEQLLQDPPKIESISGLLDSIALARKEVEKVELSFLQYVRGLQAQCLHENMVTIKKFDPHYHHRIGEEFGFNVFLGKKCAICKLFKPRRPGRPSIVCHNCGGNMKYEGRFQAGMDPGHIHKCVDCGHEVESI